MGFNDLLQHHKFVILSTVKTVKTLFHIWSRTEEREETSLSRGRASKTLLMSLICKIIVYSWSWTSVRRVPRESRTLASSCVTLHINTLKTSKNSENLGIHYNQKISNFWGYGALGRSSCRCIDDDTTRSSCWWCEHTCNFRLWATFLKLYKSSRFRFPWKWWVIPSYFLYRKWICKHDSTSKKIL